MSLSTSILSSEIPLTQAQPGDIGVAHSKGIIGRLIRLATHSRWNHVFVVVDVPANPTPQAVTVIQAEAHGVLTSRLSDVAPHGYYAILPCPPGVDRTKVVAEAKALRRTKYAFVSIASIAFNLVPWPIRLDVREDSTLICSAVGAFALLAGGWLQQFPDMYTVTPAQLAAALAN